MIAKFIISGDSVQGIQLRETIAHIASQCQLKGYAKNLLNGDVEVLFIRKDNDNGIKKCLKDAVETCRNAGLISHEDADKITINERSVNLFEVGDKTITDEALEQEMTTEKNFKVVREHELREIVWALHGAGRVFQSASEKVAEMLNYKEREVNGRIKSVKRELMHVQNNLTNVDDLVCLKQFIAEPLIDVSIGKPEEEDIMRMLIEFYYDFLRHKNTGSPSEKELVARINQLIGKFDSMKSYKEEKTNNEEVGNDTKGKAKMV